MDDSNKLIANIFCFGAFADTNNGIIYHNLTGLFPFMSFVGSVCFLYSTTMNPMPSLQRPLLGWMTWASLQRTKLTSNNWHQKSLSQSWTLWKIRPQNISRNISPRKNANYGSWSCIITASMPQSAQSRHLKLRSLQHLLLLTVISHCSCGINLPRRLRTPSTRCAVKELIPQNKHTKFWTAFMTGTGTRWPPWGAKQLYTKTTTQEAFGHPTVWMHFFLAQQRIITDATISTSLKHELTISWGQLSCTHNIVSCPPWLHISIPARWQMNWLSTLLRPMALLKGGDHSSSLELVSMVFYTQHLSQTNKGDQSLSAGSMRGRIKGDRWLTHTTVSCLTNAPSIMLMCNPIAKRVLKTMPRLHQWIPCNNTPGILPATNVIKPITPIGVNAPITEPEKVDI